MAAHRMQDPRRVAARGRRRGPLLAGVLAALTALTACGKGEPRPPNVVLVSVDALRQDHLGLYGYERDTSPGLDRFAEDCVVFDRAYTVAPWTLISHMSMFTGLYPGQHGVVDDGTRLSSEVPTLAERMQARGYHTVALYHEGWIHERFGFNRGFDVVQHHFRADEAIKNLGEALRSRPRDKPLFLFLHFWDVHCLTLKSPTATIYNPPPKYEDLWVEDAVEHLAGVISAEDVFEGRVMPTPEQREAIVALYDGGIRYVDTLLSEQLGRWRESGFLDASLVMITSDHGEALNQREGVGGHGALFEEGVRIPLLVRYPQGAGGGTRRSEFVSVVDFVPTVLELLGWPQEEWLPGYPLQGPLPASRLLLFERPPLMAILGWPWKFWWQLNRGPEMGKVFRLDEDPGELHDIRAVNDAETFERVSRELREAAEALKAGWPPPPGQAEEGEGATPEQIELLRAMGYTVGEDG